MKPTESINPNSSNIAELSAVEMVDLFISEEDAVRKALTSARVEIAAAIETVHASLIKGGRLFYLGAGTSGRLGVLDASECPPTFGSEPELVQGIIAGGVTALTDAVEGAEDDRVAARQVVEERMRTGDVLVGITASGSTPYVVSALEAARKHGIRTIAIANNKDAESFKVAELSIYLDTGAEIISGSTRLKAGTSQKLVLNILSTCAMVRLGKTRGNLMTSLRAKNDKLKARALRLVLELSGANEAQSLKALENCDYEIEAALKKLGK
jgi:N-acetylmuramic acid 6-phosphate etherase